MKRKKTLIIAGSVILILLLILGVRWRKKRLVYKGEEIRQEQVAEVLRNTLESEEFNALVRQKVEVTDSLDAFFDLTHGEYIHKQFHRLYEQNEYKPVWLTIDGPVEAVDQLLDIISRSESEGLTPDAYQPAEIRHAIDSLFPLDYEDVDLVSLLETDFMISSSALRVAAHLRFGRIDPTKQATYWKTYTGNRDLHLADYVLQAIKDGDITKEYAELIPSNQYYRGLKEAMHKYGNLATTNIPELPLTKMAYGDTGEAVLKLRQRLMYEYPDISAENSEYDSSLAAVITDIQERYGLNPDGKLNEKTIIALNVPLMERYRQIRLNLERARWLPETDNFLLVNIPEYKLRVYKAGKKEIEMRVIVGKEYTSTPIFGDTMEYLVFSPTWGVPNSIASKEMLPIIKSNPSYLTRNNYNLYRNGKKIDPTSVDWSTVSESGFNYHIVQSPGRGNALGNVKFMFPNDMNIYLHDTPTGHLFSRNERMFSHGCIRIEKPAELAEYLLNDSGEWPMEKIKQNFGMSSPKTVSLPEKLPVQIFYLTAWVDSEGRLNFREDIYGHDKKQRTQLDKVIV